MKRWEDSPATDVAWVNSTLVCNGSDQLYRFFRWLESPPAGPEGSMRDTRHLLLERPGLVMTRAPRHSVWVFSQKLSGATS